VISNPGTCVIAPLTNVMIMTGTNSSSTTDIAHEMNNMPPPPPPPPLLLHPPQQHQQPPRPQKKKKKKEAPASAPPTSSISTALALEKSRHRNGHERVAAIAAESAPKRKASSVHGTLHMMQEHAPIVRVPPCPSRPPLRGRKRDAHAQTQIPDAVADYYLSLAGVQTSDVHMKRLLALATQKFIADIAADAYQHSRVRQNASNHAHGAGAASGAAAGGAGGPSRPTARPGFGGGGSGGTAGRTVLTLEDIGNAVAEYGGNTKRPEFYR